MKKLVSILFLMMVPLLAIAQQRMTPRFDINHQVYAETIDRILMIERSALIERMENIKLNVDVLSTAGGEIILKKEAGAIRVMPAEFTKMIEEFLQNPNRGWYDIDSIRSELLLQNSKLYEYLCEHLPKVSRVRNIYIGVDSRTGISYVRVILHKR